MAEQAANKKHVPMTIEEWYPELEIPPTEDLAACTVVQNITSEAQIIQAMEDYAVELNETQDACLSMVLFTDVNITQEIYVSMNMTVSICLRWKASLFNGMP